MVKEGGKVVEIGSGDRRCKRGYKKPRVYNIIIYFGTKHIHSIHNTTTTTTTTTCQRLPSYTFMQTRFMGRVSVGSSASLMNDRDDG
ncbi:hypothetical protein E2C01_088716 [Portunus trituberculatus]|uniref:Uncharacterized protein n=1 Tax=Portunus trituberculatus TaxID=210409 RepID=A0A5B7JBH6_PORTR|nr:hypothetical protein [Portunus trituberculatus]